MTEEFFELNGIVVSASALQIVRAKQFVAAFEHDLPYLRLIECRCGSLTSGGVFETVVFDTDVERPQRLKYAIEGVERIAVSFDSNDSECPLVIALRKNFPRAPHTNLPLKGAPQSLCLYNQPWSQVSLRWTGTGFAERIRFWLAETAKGTLHKEDQPLEPLIVGSKYTLIVPPDIFAESTLQDSEQLVARFATGSDNCRVLLTAKGSQIPGLKCAVVSFMAEPQTHGVIHHNPNTLQELDGFLKLAGIDLLSKLRSRFADWKIADFLEHHLVIIVGFPMTRSEGNLVEASHLWAFMTTNRVPEVGVDIGAIVRIGTEYGQVMGDTENLEGGNTELDILMPQFDVTRKLLARASGLAADDRKVFAIGAGALGSQVIKTLASNGFGDWCIVDEDILLPHNLARHQLGRYAIGHPKALSVASRIRSMYAETATPRYFEEDILDPGEKRDELDREFLESELILDVAASVPVSRHLSLDKTGPARRLALFLNPRGTDLVMLVEDHSRSIPLDCLEMQYYRAILSNEYLAAHLQHADAGVRYARSCRDVSACIPNHLIQMHAGIGAGAIRKHSLQESAAIRVWQSDQETAEVRVISIPAENVRKNSTNGWTLTIDDGLLKKLASLRASKLPSETGGVLIGSYDLSRQIVYVVDTIPSPPDSEEWPTLYIRGKKGLAPQVTRFSEMTSGQLEYIGEWHSHPDKCSCLPSADDLKVFGWLTKNMDDAGLPALMSIVGEQGVSSWYFGQISPNQGWELQH